MFFFSQMHWHSTQDVQYPPSILYFNAFYNPRCACAARVTVLVWLPVRVRLLLSLLLLFNTPIEVQIQKKNIKE